MKHNGLKFPKLGTMQSHLLGRLLNGEKIRNLKAKDDLKSANPATIMSQLCTKKGWGVFVQKNTLPSKTANGHSTNIKEYFLSAEDILELLKNPRVESFVKTYNKLYAQ